MRLTWSPKVRRALFVTGVIVLALLLDRFPALPDDPVQRAARFWGARREMHEVSVALITLLTSLIGGITGVVAICRPRRLVIAIYTACLFVTLTGSLALLKMTAWPPVPNYRLKVTEFFTPFVVVGFAWMVAVAPIIRRRREEMLEERQGGRWGLGPPSDNS